jgi:hypothetical protein
MLGIGPIDAFFVAVAAVALPAPAVVSALVEAPPRTVMPGSVVGVAAAASLSFVVAAIGAGIYGTGLAIVGLLVAAAELAAAATIWLARGTPVDDGSNGNNGGWSGGDGPDGPRGGRLPDEYWRFWDEQFDPSPSAREDPAVSV